MFRLWCNGLYNDVEKRIGFSVIVDSKKKEYYCLLFPSFDRPEMKSFWEELKSDKMKKKETFDDVHLPLTLMQTVRKSFKLQNTSFLPFFRKELPDGCPILLTFSLNNRNYANPKLILSLKNIIIHTFIIKDLNELKRTDIEFHFMKLS